MATEAATYAQLQQQQLEQQQLTVRCQQPGCRWESTGPLLEARARFLEHQEAEHPKAIAASKKRTAARGVIEQRKDKGMCRNGCDRRHAGATKGPHHHLCQPCIDQQRADRAARTERKPSTEASRLEDAGWWRQVWGDLREAWGVE